MKQTRPYTKEQIEFRKQILNTKKRIKQKPPFQSLLQIAVKESIPNIQYMKNCIFWIEQYRDGECSSERSLSAIKSMRKHCDEVEAIIKQ